MTDFDETLERLNFHPRGLICETKRMLWINSNGDRLPSELLCSSEINPEGCQALTTKMFYIRLCPCWYDPRNLASEGKEFTDYVFHGGLMLRKIMLCAAHENYFKNYLIYPFLCPGCGVYFDSVAEVLLSEQDTEEML